VIQLNQHSAIFLDRDGVINEELNQDYVKTWDEFIFYNYSFEALNLLSKHFQYIFIATNQKGVGRQLMTEAALQQIHQTMLTQIEANGGHITKIYFCTALLDADDCRKPNPGMAFQAKDDYPTIDLTSSVMVGNNISDMQFGKNAGMQTILVNTTKPAFQLPHPHIDAQFNNLLSTAQYLVSLKA
jgi:D-glycero-D-manno-heptose 1,7-bisphosphate phosphatase